MADVVNHPPHYTAHPSGVECIQITEHMGFNLGNAVKYVWRADLKGDAIEDLRKAAWYVEREIARREAGVTSQSTPELLRGWPTPCRNLACRLYAGHRGDCVTTPTKLP